MGYFHGVKIQLFDCVYCKRTCEPYKEYMEHFVTKKNGAGRVLDKTQDIVKRRAEGGNCETDPLDGTVPGGQTTDEEYHKIIDKASFDREQAKLFLTSLLGRNNMGINRSQTIVTKSVNDVITLLGDGIRYKDAQLETFMIEDEERRRVKFGI